MPGLDSAQAAGDLSNFRGRVFLSQRRTGEQVLAHGEAADEDRFEPDPADEPLGEGDGLRIVAGDRTPTGPPGRWAISATLR